MTSLNKNRLEFYKNKISDKNDSIKYSNFSKKYLYTATIKPIIDLKTNIIKFKIPFEFFTTKNMCYIHNIQVLNNKEYLDWSLIYGRHEIDHIPNNLFKVMQSRYNISNKNIIPFDITVNNYLPVNPDLRYFIYLQVNANLNDKNVKLELLDVEDLSLTIDLFTLEMNEIVQQEHIKNLEEDIKDLKHDIKDLKDLKHDMMFKGRINHSDYKYKNKATLGFYNFDFSFIEKLNHMIWATINKTNEIRLYPYTKNTTHIIINANTNKLSNIKLYLNNNPILDLKSENIKDNIYLLHLKDENDKSTVNLFNLQKVLVTFIAENKDNLDKIKFYTISQETLQK